MQITAFFKGTCEKLFTDIVMVDFIVRKLIIELRASSFYSLMLYSNKYLRKFNVVNLSFR